MKKLIFALLLLSGVCSFAQEKDSLYYDAITDSLYRQIAGTVVVGERPVVKIKQGALVYDVPRILEKMPSDNAWEVIKNLPGVVDNNGSFQVGGRAATVVIDGKVSALGTEAVASILKATPSGRVASAEVVFNATAKYQVRGALINIVLTHGSEVKGSLQGELYGKLSNQYFNNYQGRMSLLYSKGKLSTDLICSYDRNHSYTGNEMEARHSQNDGSVYDIVNSSKVYSKGNIGTVRWGADWYFSKDHSLSFVYYGSFSGSGIQNSTIGSQVSKTNFDVNGCLNNLRLDYKTPFGFTAGVEYTNNQAPSTQIQNSTFEGTDLYFKTETRQSIARLKAFAAQEHALDNGWGLNYGATFETAADNSHQWYYDPDSGEIINVSGDEGFSSRNTERNFNVYGGFGKSFNDKLSIEGSLAVENFKNASWNEWNLYPTFNLSWKPTASHVVQFGLSSDKTYPAYWALQSSTTRSDAYTEIVGNPNLKPAKEYSASLSYILKSKYFLTAYFSHTKDYIIQTLYQNQDRPVQTYGSLNEDFMQQGGLQLSAPLFFAPWQDSRLTLIGGWQREKDSDYYDIPFDRAIWFGMAVLSNTFTLAKKPDLKLLVNGFYRTKGIQGTYYLPSSGNLDISLRYGFAGGRALLTLFCNDILETSVISPYIDYANQRYRSSYTCFRTSGVSFTWKIGAYKEKQRGGIDTSRFK